MGDTRSHYTLLNITTQHWPMAAVACYYMVSEIAVVYGASKARREVKRSGTAPTADPLLSQSITRRNHQSLSEQSFSHCPYTPGYHSPPTNYSEPLLRPFRLP